MTKKKRTYNSEVIAPLSLDLQKTVPALQKQPVETAHPVAPRQFFPPELINRLAEKIRKL